MSSQPIDPVAVAVVPSTHNSGTYSGSDDDDDEYGSFDIGEKETAILDAILAVIDAQSGAATVTSTSTPAIIAADSQSSPIRFLDDIEDAPLHHEVRVSNRQGQGQPQLHQQVLRDVESTSVGVHHHHRQNGRHQNGQQQNGQKQHQVLQKDSRSPLERFRRTPNKALSVTDLVSPAWCELQFYYTLSKHGRKRPSPAMKQGTKIHRQLEDEVHMTVPVEVVTLEDRWALRLWNVIQGLTTLRETGRTRELEVWGTVGGEIVTGIIDEVGYACPDLKLKAVLDAARRSGKKINPSTSSILGNTVVAGGDELPEYREHQNIREFMTTASQEEEDPTSTSTTMSGPMNDEDLQIYITDIKTRTNATLPTGSSTEPTILQLHLYHHMLENLAQGNFSLAQLTQRYNLDADARFSDSFIAQMMGLDQQQPHGLCTESEDGSSASSSQNASDLILTHNTLSSLWDLMISAYRTTFLLPLSCMSTSTSTSASGPPASTPQSVSDIPAPASQPTRISPILTAKYLGANYSVAKNRTTISISAAASPTKRGKEDRSTQYLGRKSFIFDPLYLKAYLEDSLAWWRGERDAVGVQLQEAWKCRSCAFRDDCDWLIQRDLDAWEKVAARKALRGGPTGGSTAAAAAGKSRV